MTLPAGSGGRRTRPIGVEDGSGGMLVELDQAEPAGPDGTAWSLVRKPLIGRFQHVDGPGDSAGRIRLTVGPSKNLVWSLRHVAQGSSCEEPISDPAFGDAFGVIPARSNFANLGAQD